MRSLPKSFGKRDSATENYAAGVLAIPFATLAAVGLLLSVGLARGDEAVLLNGKRIPGNLRFHDGKLSFTSGQSDGVLGWNQIERVDLTQPTTAEAAPPGWWRATLINGDHFTCRIQDIESNAFVCDSAWFRGLRLRRGVVRGFERPEGWCPLINQDLGRDVQGWKETHETGEITDAVGMGGLVLGPITRSLQFAPGAPLPLGRVVLAMKDGAVNGGKRWQARFELEEDKETRTLSINLGANAGVDVQSTSLKLRHQNGKIEGAAILLDFESGPESLRIQANGQLVGWTETGLHNPRLRSVTIEPMTGAPPQDGTAKLTLHEFAVARRLEPLPRPLAHPELDEAWLESGDQAFGEFRSLSARELGLAASKVTRRLPANQIRGLYPRTAPLYHGQPTKLWRFTLLDPSGGEPARLTGTIRSWDASHIVIVHAILGEIKVPRAQVRSVSQINSRPAELRPESTKVIQP